MEADNATTGHIFISYPRDDSAGAEWARRIHERLAARGIPCWRDETYTRSDDLWSRGIPGAIDGAALVLCVVSRASAGRDSVQKELLYALDQRKPAVGVRVEQAAELPFPLYGRPVEDLSHGFASAWTHLERRLDELLGRTGAPGRQAETAYLHRLLAEHCLREVGRLYTPLAGDHQACRFLARILPETLIPVGLRLERRAGDGMTAQLGDGGQPFDDALAALAASDRLVVLGEPGAGKTFSLWRRAAQLARQALEDAAAPLPVLVDLGEWIDPGQPLEAFADARLGPLCGRLEALREGGRLALLLDGLDELPSAQREAKAAAIRVLAEDPRLALMTASCRERDYTGPLRLDLDTLTLCPLDPPGIHAFTTRYLAVLDPDHGSERGEALFWHLAGAGAARAWRAWQEAGLDLVAFWTVQHAPELRLSFWQRWLPWRRRPIERKQALIESLEDERASARDDPRSLLRLARNPYLLTMMVGLYLAHGTEALAGDRSALFARFAADRIEREDRRHRAATGGAPHPGRRGLEAGLGDLAWTLQTRAGGPDTVQLALPREQAAALLSPDGLRLAQAANLLDAGEPLRFTHPLLQEYFAGLGARSIER